MVKPIAGNVGINERVAIDVGELKDEQQAQPNTGHSGQQKAPSIFADQLSHAVEYKGRATNFRFDRHQTARFPCRFELEARNLKLGHRLTCISVRLTIK